MAAAEVMIRDRWIPERVRPALNWNPKSRLGDIVQECFSYLPPALAEELLDRISTALVVESSLRVRILTPASWFDGIAKRTLELFNGEPHVVEDHGWQSPRMVTTAGVNFLVAVWTGSGALTSFQFHGLGRGVGAESTGDTLLGTELTTEYGTPNTRATGTRVVGASNNILRSVATNTLGGTPGGPLTEWGLFSSSASGAITLWDRKLMGPFTLVSGQSIQTQIDNTFAAGG